MADARDQALPLVTTGDPELVEHDFHAIFSSLGVLNYDTKIGATVRFLGFSGMIGVTVWLAFRLKAGNTKQPVPVAFQRPAMTLVQRFPGKRATTAPPPVSNEKRAQLDLKPDPGE